MLGTFCPKKTTTHIHTTSSCCAMGKPRAHPHTLTPGTHNTYTHAEKAGTRTLGFPCTSLYLESRPAARVQPAELMSKRRCSFSPKKLKNCSRIVRVGPLCTPRVTISAKTRRKTPPASPEAGPQIYLPRATGCPRRGFVTLHRGYSLSSNTFGVQEVQDEQH